MKLDLTWLLPYILNWKTSLAGLITIAVGAADTFFGINIPGFPATFADFYTALPIGLGLIFAKDANIHGPVVPAVAPSAPVAPAA